MTTSPLRPQDRRAGGPAYERQASRHSEASPLQPPSDAAEIRFRPLDDGDLDVLHRWLNEPGVVRWWEGDDVSWEAVQQQYGSASGDAGVEHWLATLDGSPLGWAQCYGLDDAPDDAQAWAPFGVGAQAAGIDYLVGDPGARGRGLGTRMIRAFVRDVVFGRHPAWSQVCAAPEEENVASWRALARAGFSDRGTVVRESGRTRLMVLDRADAERR